MQTWPPGPEGPGRAAVRWEQHEPGEEAGARSLPLAPSQQPRGLPERVLGEAGWERACGSGWREEEAAGLGRDGEGGSPGLGAAPGMDGPASPASCSGNTGCLSPLIILRARRAFDFIAVFYWRYGDLRQQ